MSFHVNPKTGDPGICRANYACPFGGDESHFDTPEEARAEYELRMADEVLPAPAAQLSFFSHLDEEVAESVGSGYSVIEHENFKLEKDYSVYESDVWRGLESTSSGYGRVELWVSSDFRNPNVRGYVEVDGDEQMVFQEPFEGELTDSMRAAAFAQLFTAAKERAPEIFDPTSTLYQRRLEVEEQVQSGQVQIGDFTLHNQGGVAPQIWETEPNPAPGVEEVYVRVRHDWASGRVKPLDGETESLLGMEAKTWHESTTSQAMFFMKLNDEMLRWDAER